MSIKKRVNKIESDILSTKLSKSEKQKKLHDFLLNSLDFPEDIKYILEKHNIVIEFGADYILNNAFNNRKYETVKVLIQHINDVKYIFNSVIIEDVIYTYSLYQDKTFYEIFKMLIEKYHIINFAYKKTLNHNFIKKVVNLIILCINNGCNINLINDSYVKSLITQHFRKEKLNKIIK